MRRWFWIAALALAILALVSTVADRRDGWQAAFRTGPPTAALAGRRPIEPRLTGAFGYVPCTSAEEPQRLIPRTKCSPPAAAAEIKAFQEAVGDQQETRGGGGAEQLRADGLTLVLDGKLERAVAAFEAAARSGPGDARALSDLAAVRLALAEEQDEPSGLIRALADVRRALQIDPDLVEAQFNHALLLERLVLLDQAKAAWDLSGKNTDDRSWAGEAEKHLVRLSAPLLPDLWNARQTELAAAARRGDTATVRAIVSSSPQDARELAVEKLLGTWGELLLQGQPEPAAETLALARAVGEALLASTGESSVAGAVQAIDRAASRRREANLHGLARGHIAYRDGSAALQQQQTDRPAELLEEARETLAQGRSPAEAWAHLGLAGVKVRLGDYDQAIEKYAALVEDGGAIGSPALQGKAEWGIGISHIRQGHYSEALAHYRAAALHFNQAREALNLGFVREMTAECLRFLGQRDAAWRSRYQAIKALSPHRASFRLHTVLWEAGWAAIEDGAPEAALAFLDEDVGLAERSKQPHWLAESLLWRSKIRLGLGDPTAALADLERAQRFNGTVAEARLRERLGADLAYVEGEVRRRIEPQTALAPYTEALDYYRAGELYLDLAGTLLGRFHAALAAGRMAEAEADLSEAIGLFETQRDRLKEGDSRISYSEASQGLYDAMILLQAEKKGDPDTALGYSERARTVALGPRMTSSSSSAKGPRETLAGLPDDLAVIEYARVENRLFTWLIWRGRIQAFPQTVAQDRLEGAVRRFVTAIQRREPKDRIDALAKHLYRLLIPSAVAGLPAGIELGFVPDKILNTLPFAALRNPRTGRYLIEERTIRILPGLSRVAALRTPSERGSPPTALLVAATVFDRQVFPDLDPLPGAAAEIAAIGPVYAGGSSLQGHHATKERVLAEIDRHEIFHLAGHSTFNERHPDQSYFVLAPSGGPEGDVLFLHEIAARRFERLRLVVLSSCRSLGPQETRIVGISGLARPFLDSGVEAVVGSLWDVGDRAAAQLIPEFHRRYLAGGDAAEALRGAQVAMLRSGDPRLETPAAWAVFQAVRSLD